MQRLEAAIGPADEALDLHGYLELILTSGFPEPALRLSVPAREAWLDSYVDQLLTRDVALVDARRDPHRLRRYLEAYATMTAQVVDESTLLEAAGVNRKTAGAYEQLLRNLFVLDALPAWSSNRVKQLVQSPKRMISDPAVAASVLRLDKASLLRAGNLLCALLETFVVAQLRADAAGLSRPPGLHHLRTRGGRPEVDVVVELGADRIVGIEVKATAAPGSGDAKHLLWLRELLGERFHGGLVLHTGARTFKLGPGIMAAPLSVLWQ